MVGQHLDALHIAERVDESPQTAQLGLVVGDAGHKHMADPHRHAEVGEAAGTVEDVFIAMTGELTMRLRVDMLQVEEHGVGNLHQPQELAIEGFTPRKRLPCRVEAGIDAAAVGFLKEADETVDLQQGLAAADGDTTLVAPVSPVALRLVEQLCHRPGFLVSPGHAPRVGIMAIAATHVAAFEEDDETNAGTVDRAERLDGVNV